MAAARKKKPLEPEVEAKVNELLGAVKRPRTLQELHAALVALPRSGEAGAAVVSGTPAKRTLLVTSVGSASFAPPAWTARYAFWMVAAAGIFSSMGRQAS